jgi:hypothetical protein
LLTCLHLTINSILEFDTHGIPKVKQQAFNFYNQFTRPSHELLFLNKLRSSQDFATGISKGITFGNGNTSIVDSEASENRTSQNLDKNFDHKVSSMNQYGNQGKMDRNILSFEKHQPQINHSQNHFHGENGRTFHPFLCGEYQTLVCNLSDAHAKTVSQDAKFNHKPTPQLAKLINQLNPSFQPMNSKYQTLYCAHQSITNDERTQDQLSISLYLSPQDDDHLSDYQCLVRKQIEYFEAGEDDIHASAQGRNKPITLKQVGIRCRHCSQRLPQHRTRGSTYYPTKVRSIYQAAQNLARIHLCENCPLIPEIVRREIIRLRITGATSEGKRYWAQSAKIKGIVESDDILVLRLKENRFL